MMTSVVSQLHVKESDSVSASNTGCGVLATISVIEKENQFKTVVDVHKLTGGTTRREELERAQFASSTAGMVITGGIAGFGGRLLNRL